MTIILTKLFMYIINFMETVRSLAWNMFFFVRDCHGSALARALLTVHIGTLYYMYIIFHIMSNSIYL